jgi:hypothetical protein
LFYRTVISFMNKLLPIILLFSLPVNMLNAQYPAGSWSDNMSYNSGQFVVAAEGKIFCSTISGIIVYDPAYASISKLSTVGGLTETGLSTIAYSSQTTTLIIAYNSTNIDLIRGGKVTNMPEILRKNIAGLKEIYRIRTSGNRAYLACSFGIVVIDLLRDEVYDTWSPGENTGLNQVFDIAFSGNTILAATNSGIYEAELNNPGLAYFGNWNRQNNIPSPSAPYNCIAVIGNSIFANRTTPTPSTDTVFVWNGSWEYLYQTASNPNLSFETTVNNELVVSSSLSVRVLNLAGALMRETTNYGSVAASPSNAILEGNTLWVADRNNGLVEIPGPSQSQILLPPGPRHNSVVNLRAEDGDLYIAGGAVTNAWNNTWTPLQVSYYINGNWATIPASTFSDPLRIIPGKSENYFISTWGMGLLEYSGTTLLNHYDQYNSPLNSVIPGSPYVRLSGMAFDKEENLWIIHSGVTENIKVLRPDRTWVTIPVTIEAPTIGDLIITQTGKKWIVLPRGHGLFIYDDNGTLSDFTDDSYRKMLVRDVENNLLSNVYSVTEDLDGTIWVGTDQGPAIYYNPDRAFNEEVRAVRIKIPRNDGTGLADFLLSSEIITSIAVDGANRKWVGTLNSGAYLLSADGTTRLKHFTVDNSPLLSNTVTSVSADLSNGLVWFGTSNGVISYRSDAPGGKSGLEGAFSFPNPVRHDYMGVVTITGLVRDTNVKITDISGNLVYETTSTGSEATWDLMNYRGERVSTGVYLAFCATPDGSGTAIVKMLIVK